jgi:hypothetical protein
VSRPILSLKFRTDLDPLLVQELDQLVAAINAGFRNLDTASLGLVNTGYRIARGQAVTASAVDTVTTGLTTVIVAIGELEDVPVIGCDRAQAVVGTQAGAPAAGLIYVKTFKPTAAGDATPIPATTFGKKVNWFAVGT